MIIPIGHDRAVRGWPQVTIAIIAVCTVVQIYATVATPSEARLGRMVQALDAATPDDAEAIEAKLREVVQHMPFVRFGYRTGSGVSAGLVTSAFVHEGWLHLIGNMLFLFLAGSALEDRWGRARFLAFYVAGAIASALCFDLLHSGDGVAILGGASGAIAALMGAFLVYFATTRIRLWYWLWRFTGTWMVPAYTALPLWLGEQILWSSLGESRGGIAYTAHIGGFVFGGALAGMLRLFRGRGDAEVGAPPPATRIVKLAKPPGRLPSGPTTLDQRYAHCMAAIEARDATTARALSSRLMLELSRMADHARGLALFRAIASHLEKLSLTDAAFASAAAAADALGDSGAYIAIATAMLAEQPTSRLTPKIGWRLAEHYRDGGRIEFATATLQALVDRFPLDPFGVRAREALAGRRATSPQLLDT